MVLAELGVAGAAGPLGVMGAGLCLMRAEVVVL